MYAKNSVFPGGVAWRSLVKQETNKAFVFNKRSPNDVFCMHFFLKSKCEPGGKNAGQ